jgi:purine-nucleoside phosphorylase
MTDDFRAGDRIDYGFEEIDRAVSVIRERTPLDPRIACAFGSGLGAMADLFTEREEFASEDLPGFPQATVSGHSGKFVVGRLDGVPVVAQVARFHLYEGYPASVVSFPTRVMSALGAEVFLVTNVSGGMNPGFRPGDIMLIEDHLNLQFRSPIRGSGPMVDEDRFVDLAEPYSRRLLDLARSVAIEEKIPRIQVGTYCGVLGPSYETRSEIAMLRKLGGDAVGMSTVPEVITARHRGMEVLGISCISNLATGLSREPLRHEDVILTAKMIEERLKRFLSRLIHRSAEAK